jgi:hypothetical protein
LGIRLKRPNSLPTNRRKAASAVEERSEIVTILERQIQRIRPGKWEALEEIDKKNTVIEERHGYPPKTRYSYLSGEYDWNTLVIEREWESFAAAEAAVTKFQEDPESKELNEPIDEIVESIRMEFLLKLE